MTKALRVRIKQASANYRKEESATNKMTYPLPPVSTIIGAIHKACGYKEYHPMDISIQGTYKTLHLEPYKDYCFLDSLNDDRGTLVKVRNEELLSTAYDKVASAIKSQGNSFMNGITINVHNKLLLEEYRELKQLKEKLSEEKRTTYKAQLDEYKKEKQQLAKDRKAASINSQPIEALKLKEQELKKKEQQFKDEFKAREIEQSKALSKFKSLVVGIKYYEILNDIDLIIHIRSDEKVLHEIEENIYNIKSIGRSEDFINVEECELVTLTSDFDEEVENYRSAYLMYSDVKDEHLFTKADAGRSISGTAYYLNKDYTVIDGKRVFNKKRVVYTSGYFVDEGSENVFLDRSKSKTYIVNFI